MSARQLKGQVGISYPAAWLLEQKLRRSMVDPNRERLDGVVEIDQTQMPFRAGDDLGSPLKTGKILIVGAVEILDHSTGKAHKPKKYGDRYLDTLSGRIRLAAIPSNEARHLHAFITANVAAGTTLLTDGHASYPGLPGYRHDPRVVGNMAGHVPLKWIHRVFALLKRWSLGIYHGLRPQHIDAYLNEFVFRYNRRFYRHVSFESILGLAAGHGPSSYWDIIGQANPRKGVEAPKQTARRRRTADGMRSDGTGPRRRLPKSGKGNNGTS
jgi:ISXO2-like transposase domain